MEGTNTAAVVSRAFLIATPTKEKGHIKRFTIRKKRRRKLIRKYEKKGNGDGDRVKPGKSETRT